MNKILAFLALLLAIPAMPLFAQTDAIQGYCSLGGTKTKTQGANSTNYMQGVIPSCTVTVYFTGTTVKPPQIYADRIGTPLSNPFTADAFNTTIPIDGGKWIFWAPDNQGYDVVMSGGIAPNTFPAPVTLVDLKVGGGGGTTGLVSINSQTGPALTFQSTGGTVTITNPTTNVFNFEASGGGGTGCIPISDGGHCVTDNPTVSQDIVQPTSTQFSASNGGSDVFQTFLGVEVQNNAFNPLGANHRGVLLGAGNTTNLYVGAPAGATPASIWEIQAFAGQNQTAYLGLGLSQPGHSEEFTNLEDDSLILGSKHFQWGGCADTSCRPGIDSGPFQFTNASGGPVTYTLPTAIQVWGTVNPFTPISTQVWLFKSDSSANHITINVAGGDTIACPAGLAACTSTAYTLSNQWDGVWLSSNGLHTWVVSQAYPVSSGGGGGVTSINSTAGAFTFSFSAGAGSCSGTTCTFTGSGSGGGTVTNFIANTGSWPSWLAPSVATSTTTPTLSVVAGPIPNSALQNASTTVNGVTCTLGSTCTVPITQAPTVGSSETVSFSTTPTFSTSTNLSRITMTASITSFTLGAGTDGQNKTLCFKQGAGAYTVTPPANVHGFFTIGSTATLWNCQTYTYDATDTTWLAISTGVLNE